jgi:hypothetical protein
MKSSSLPIALRASVAFWGLTALAAPVPATRVDAVHDVLHGIEIADPYRWLEDQESRETRAWIDAQNAHTDAALAALPGRGRIAARLGELLRVDEIRTCRCSPCVRPTARTSSSSILTP